MSVFKPYYKIPDYEDIKENYYKIEWDEELYKDFKEHYYSKSQNPKAIVDQYFEEILSEDEISKVDYSYIRYKDFLLKKRLEEFLEAKGYSEIEQLLTAKEDVQVYWR